MVVGGLQRRRYNRNRRYQGCAEQGNFQETMHVGVLLTDSMASILPFITSLTCCNGAGACLTGFLFSTHHGRPQAYVPAVDEMLGDRCDLAQLIKFNSQS